jgi:hypothetical protein
MLQLSGSAGPDNTGRAGRPCSAQLARMHHGAGIGAWRRLLGVKAPTGNASSWSALAHGGEPQGMRAMPRIRLSVAEVLKSPETRKACAVLEHVHAAMLALDELPPPVLEALRDEFKEMAETRTGPRGELRRAWLNFTQQALEDARQRDRQETFGMYRDLR